MQVAAGAYLVLIAGHQAMGGANHQQHQQVGQRRYFVQQPPLCHGTEAHQFAERLVEQFHLSVKVSMPQQKPVRQAPAQQGSHEAFGLQGLEVVGAYPEHRHQKGELGQSHAACAQEHKGVEHIGCRLRVLVTPEQEEQCQHQCQCRRIAGMQRMQGGTHGYQQYVDHGLHRCPHADNGVGVVEQDEQPCGQAVQQIACRQ